MSRAIMMKTAVLFAATGLTGLAGAVGAQQRDAPPPERTQASEDAAPAQGTIGVPQRPQHDGDPGGPGQGRQAQAAQGKRPDLALVDAFQLGSTSIPWGSPATVAASDAAKFKSGRCLFRYKYVTRNVGSSDAAAFINRVHRDTSTGPILAKNAVTGLLVGASVNSDGHLLLAPGTWMLYVAVDDPSAIAEGNEANNLRRVRVTVEGNCS